MNTLLQWFVTSSVLILAVLALRRLLGGRISPRVKYALWGVVLLRLLVPFQIPMPNLPTAADLTPEPNLPHPDHHPHSALLLLHGGSGGGPGPQSVS